MELAKEKKDIFCNVYFARREFFETCVLSQFIVYWMHFQNIHTFLHIKKHYTLLLLVFKIVFLKRKYLCAVCTILQRATCLLILMLLGDYWIGTSLVMIMFQLLEILILKLMKWSRLVFPKIVSLKFSKRSHMLQKSVQSHLY